MDFRNFGWVALATLLAVTVVVFAKIPVGKGVTVVQDIRHYKWGVEAFVTDPDSFTLANFTTAPIQYFHSSNGEYRVSVTPWAQLPDSFGRIALSNLPRKASTAVAPLTGFSQHLERIRIQNATLFAAPAMDHDWLERTWTWIKTHHEGRLDATPSPHDSAPSNIETVRDDGHACIICDGPTDGDRVFIKLYRRRAGHNLARRLRPNRARREGQGLLAFARHGLRTPTLLAYGDERFWGLFEHGFVITVLQKIEDIPTCYYRDPDEDTIIDAVNMLANIHQAGFAHGDACIRNFAMCDSTIMAIDLPSWGRFSKKRWIDDLIRFLGSTLKLSDNQSLVNKIANIYENSYGTLPLAKNILLTRAAAFAASKHRP